MTYIQQFLSQHIISYYLATLKATLDKQSFVNFHNQHNFFSLTSQILLFGENITKSKSRKWLIDLIQKNINICYEDLKDASLPLRDYDSETIRWIKSQFPYVYIQMHQIMTRIILAYLIIEQEQNISPEVQTLAKEIGYIYPALKAEISFNQTQINLTGWFEQLLSQIIQQKLPNSRFFRFLAILKDQCILLGPMDKLFDQIIKLQQRQQMFREKQYESSLYEDSRSQMSKFSQDKTFNDLQMLRKKKKIFKDRYKIHHSNVNNYVTPQKSKQIFLPSTQKTDLVGLQQQYSQKSLSQSQNHQTSHTPSSTFSKLLKKYKKPMVRTIYHGSTKIFVPKKSMGGEQYNSDQYIQKLTASSLTSSDSQPVHDIHRKYSTKYTKLTFDSDDKGQFCVPQTPKLQPFKVSVNAKGTTVEGSKSIVPRLKI